MDGSQPDQPMSDEQPKSLKRPSQDEPSTSNEPPKKRVATLNEDDGANPGPASAPPEQDQDDIVLTSEQIEQAIGAAEEQTSVKEQELAALRADLEGQATKVHQLMNDFESAVKIRKDFPKAIFLIEKAWWIEWKLRVRYGQLFGAKEKPSPFNALQSSSLLGKGSLGSLGQKLKEEQEFRMKKEADSQQEKYPRTHLEEALTKPLRPVGTKSLLRFPDDDPNRGMCCPILRKDFRLETHAVGVPYQVYDLLGQAYGKEMPVHRTLNTAAESWHTSLELRYIMHFDEIRFIEMIPLQDPMEFVEIEQLDGKTLKAVPRGATINSISPPLPTLTLPPPPTNPLPPPPSTTLPPPPPPSGSEIIPPPPGSGPSVPPPPTLSPVPLPPSQGQGQGASQHIPANNQQDPQDNQVPPAPPSASIPPPPQGAGGSVMPPPPSSAASEGTKKTFPFKLRQGTIFSMKSQTVSQVWFKLLSEMEKKGKTSQTEQEEDQQALLRSIRIWRYSASSDMITSFDGISQQLGQCFTLMDFQNAAQANQAASKDEGMSEVDLIETNSGLVFPGININIMDPSKVIGSFKTQTLCSPKEILFIEKKQARQDSFTFKFSPNQKDYTKCKHPHCSKVGLIDRVPCICKTIFYCSQKCCDRDHSHIIECEEHKRREYDPEFMDFSIGEKPRYGKCGLVNQGNTCYMNAALQCLSNTTPLRQYFLRLQRFKDELNKTNALASKDNRVTILFAKLLQQLWNENKASSYGYEDFRPDQLKLTIGRENSMFAGFNQNDSHELVSFLLDQMHEDLNRVKTKPLVSLPDDLSSQIQSVEKLALIFDEMHLKRNQSIIKDLLFGQYMSTIECYTCKRVSKNVEQFMTLNLALPRTKADFKFYFIPHRITERPFYFELDNLAMMADGDDLTNPVSLFGLKKKICHIIKQFYSQGHDEPKYKPRIRYHLSSHSGNHHHVEIYPQDLVVTLVANWGKSKFEFKKLFSEHKGHNLNTLIESQETAYGPSTFFVYQVDPQAINLEKVRTYFENNELHNLQFPAYMKEDWIQVPVEIGVFDRNHYEETNPDFDPDEENPKALQPGEIKKLLESQPPRMLAINLNWSLPEVHRVVMSHFCEAVENKSAAHPMESISKPSLNQNTGWNNPYSQQTNINNQDPFGYPGQDGEPFGAPTQSTVLDDDIRLSDDDQAAAPNNYQIPSSPPQIGEWENHDFYGSSNTPEEIQFQPRPSYTFDELFLHFNQFIHMTKKMPDQKDLDSFVGSLNVPIGLHIITRKQIVHLPLINHSGKNFFCMFTDQKLFKESNDSIYDDPNPEQIEISKPRKFEIIKFLIAFNSSSLPEGGGQAGHIQAKFQNFTTFSSTSFEFDKFSNLVKTCDDSSLPLEFDEQGNQVKGIQAPPTRTITLEDCLVNMNKKEILQDDNAYYCSKCQQHLKAAKQMQILKVPPVLVVCIQRFKGQMKNNEFIKYPIAGLDMKDYLPKESGLGHGEAIYDLYGVVNHFGSLGFGHYNATCFNEELGCWLYYNDSQVTELTLPTGHADPEKWFEESIITSNAYMLFYKRRGFNPTTHDDFEALKIMSTGAVDEWINIEHPDASKPKTEEASTKETSQPTEDVEMENLQSPNNQSEQVAAPQVEIQEGPPEAPVEMNNALSNPFEVAPASIPAAEPQLKDDLLQFAPEADEDDLQQIQMIEAQCNNQSPNQNMEEPAKPPSPKADQFAFIGKTDLQKGVEEIYEEGSGDEEDDSSGPPGGQSEDEDIKED